MRARLLLLTGGLGALVAVPLASFLAGEPPGADGTLVRRSDLVLTVPLEGSLEPHEAHQLGPPVTRGFYDFKIAFMAPEGAEVRESELVLAFDASELERQLLERQAELDATRAEIEKKEMETLKRRADDALRLAEARAKLDKARLKLERPSELVAARELRSFEIDRDLAEREVRYLTARAKALDEADRTLLQSLAEQRDRARARIVELQEAIERMSVTAPRDGTVLHVQNRAGEKKSVGDSVWRHEKVLAVPDLRDIRAVGFVDEFDAGRVAVGQRVELRLDAYPETSFGGVVSKVGGTVQRMAWRSPLLGLRLEVTLDDVDVTRMRPGMRFRGSIEIGRIDDALLVPVAAVEREKGTPVVDRVLWRGVERVRVRLGRRNGEAVEILAGLVEGDRVAIPERESSP